MNFASKICIILFSRLNKKRYAQNPHISLKNNSTTKIEADTPKSGDTTALKAYLFTDIQPLQSIPTGNSHKTYFFFLTEYPNLPSFFPSAKYSP